MLDFATVHIVFLFMCRSVVRRTIIVRIVLSRLVSRVCTVGSYARVDNRSIATSVAFASSFVSHRVFWAPRFLCGLLYLALCRAKTHAFLVLWFL